MLSPFSAFAFAIVQIVLASAALLLQLVTLPLFLAHKDYRGRASHQMMLSIGLFDCTQLATHLWCSVCFVFGIQMGATDIGGGINLVGWDALTIQHLLLALNRSATIILPYFRPASIDSKRTEKLFKALELVLWLWYLGTVVLFQTPLLGCTFNAEFIGYDLDASLPLTELYQNFDFYVTIGIPGASFCLYVGIIATIIKSRTLGQGSTANSGVQQPVLMTAHEKRILVQAVVLFAGMFCLVYFWFVVTSAVGQQCMIFALLCYCGLNPVLYLVMNGEFRERFCNFYSCKWTSQSGNNAVVVVKQSLHVISSVHPIGNANRFLSNN